MAQFEQCYHFRLIYNLPAIFPIYGALRHVYGQPWELYKRVGRLETEEYRFAGAWPSEPTPAQITDAIAQNIGPVVYDPAFPDRV